MLLLTWDQFTIDSQTKRDGSRRIAFFVAHRRISSGILFHILEIAKPSNFTFVLTIILSKHVGRSAHIQTPTPYLLSHTHTYITSFTLQEREVQKIELQQGRMKSAAASSEASVSQAGGQGPQGGAKGHVNTGSPHLGTVCLC